LITQEHIGNTTNSELQVEGDADDEGSREEDSDKGEVVGFKLEINGVSGNVMRHYDLFDLYCVLVST